MATGCKKCCWMLGASILKYSYLQHMQETFVVKWTIGTSFFDRGTVGLIVCGCFYWWENCAPIEKDEPLLICWFPLIFHDDWCMFFSIDCLGPRGEPFEVFAMYRACNINSSRGCIQSLGGWGFIWSFFLGWRIHQTRCRISVGRHAYLHTAAWCSKHRKSRVRCGFCPWGAGKNLLPAEREREMTEQGFNGGTTTWQVWSCCFHSVHVFCWYAL